jgi:hypothetical protein
MDFSKDVKENMFKMSLLVSDDRLAVFDILLCISQTFCHCDKIPERNNLRKEGFILTHCFSGFTPRLAGSLNLR